MSRFRRFALAVAILACISTARARDDKWVEARSPNFIVVSDAGASQARNLAIQFEQIRALFRQTLPVAKDQPTPVITILAAKDENSLRALLPEYWETKGRAHPAGIFLNTLYQMQMAVQLSGVGENPYEPIYHEYYHSLTVPYFPGLPVWIAEGLADFYGNSRVADKTAYMGMADAGLIELLRQEPLIPLPVLFQVDHSSPYYNESKKTSIFYAESWALIHFLMLGENNSHRPQLSAYLDALSHGESQEAATAKAFGDPVKLQKALQAYVSNFNFYEMRTAAPARLADSEVKVRPLSDAEADAYRGGFLALHKQFDPAAALLQQATQNDPKLALGQRNLAVLDYLQDKSDDAYTALGAAIALDPSDALARFLRARMEQGISTSETQSAQIDADLRAAIAADPNLAPAYSMLAGRLAARGQNLPEAFELARKSVELEPGVPGYQYVLAQVLARAGKYDQAEKVVNAMAANSLDPQTKTNAAQFLEYLQKLRTADARRAQYYGSAPATNSRPQASAPPPASSASSASAADSADDSDDSDDEPDQPANDGKQRVDGSITDVQCKGQDMVVTLATADGTIKLHAPDNTKVDYISDIQLKSETFWPCTSLQGHTVKAKFLPPPQTGKQPYQGELTSIEIRK